MLTLYCVTIRIHATDHEKTLYCTSATERALMIISLSPYVDIVREYETTQSPATEV